MERPLPLLPEHFFVFQYIITQPLEPLYVVLEEQCKSGFSKRLKKRLPADTANLLAHSVCYLPPIEPVCENGHANLAVIRVIVDV